MHSPRTTGSSASGRRPSPLRRAARSAGLIYSTDDRPGYQRRGSPPRFWFLNTRGRRIRNQATLRRIRRLVIPPAWTDVWINPRARGHIQARGRDARGRKQYIYHPDWLAARDETKFGQLVDFARALPALRRSVAAHLRRPLLDRDRVTAVVVRLLETSLIRVGNAEYARVNKSYGLTTLTSRHARVSGPRIRFSFNGKGGLRHRIELEDRLLARQMRRLQELPGQQLFQYRDASGRWQRIRSEDVNAYIRKHTASDFTARHFRTWSGTVIAALELAAVDPHLGDGERKRAITAAVRRVAARLGNTPAVARKSYIHPAVFDAFARGELHAMKISTAPPTVAVRTGLSSAERAVLRVIRSSRRMRRP